ncbi:hypothetical protein H0H81_000668 [Sphagnurus paluster]|uniref:U4/U6.U5 small nuclear ribonucleoprotein 27kDa protein domain-containing protein n=1 Tax=Sphagnurus paluster TaxID=117069 RepID=A0A9P7K724_9AGAR|nr:hypothetical protein H0H81_000668 [Sphagnurus paluster]
MSSRPEHHRRERSWERDDRDRAGDRGRYSRGGRGGASRPHYDDRRRSSRSRSPRRGGDTNRERRPDRREPHRRDKEDERRDRDRERDRDRRDDRGGRRRDDDRERDGRDERRDAPRKEDSKDGTRRPREDEDTRNRTPQPFVAAMPKNNRDSGEKTNHSRPNLDPDEGEEGEAMDAENDDDAAMMATMGLSGFGSTKGKPVEGNQEGAVQIKKQRTWRQYMNRRGGFNRPLDKIK